jgi:hypothetical protein
VTNGAMANGQLTWLIRKGDLLLSGMREETQREFDFNFRETDDRVLRLPIYEYPDDDIPDRFESAKEGIVEII